MRAALLHGSIIEVRGEDAREWLNGQLTSNIADLKEGEIARGLKLEKTGRIMSMPLVFAHRVEGEDAFDLFVERTVAKDMIEDLDRYIIMEDAELNLREEARALFIAGDEAEGARLELYGMSGAIRFLADGEEPALEGAELLDERALERERLKSGVPNESEFSKRLLPQEAGLKALVSFTKGCYLGQEPVVMLEHRGSPPKRLIRLQAEAELAAGDPITDEAGATIGEITSALRDGEQSLAIGILRKRGFALETLYVNGKPTNSHHFIGEPPKAG